MADEPEPMETGWEPATPPGDTVLRDYLTAWAAWLEDLARACGGRAERHDDVVLCDLGSPSMFLNNALSLQPPEATDVDDLVHRVETFFGGSGGGYAWFNAWPMPDLRSRGFELGGHPPFMLRTVGGTARPSPAGLRIEEVADDRARADFERAAILGFPLPGLGEGSSAWGPGVIGVDDLHIFVGYDGDEPVTTASSHVGEHLQHVEFVATRPEWRGRGYGEAVTWRATLTDPTLPAVLIASDDGRPVYERMGYLPVTRFTLWIGTR